MNQSKMLNYILGTTSKVEILRVLFESDDAMTGRRIAATAKISPRSCQLSLDSLVKNNVLFRKAVGRAYSYTINREHKMVWDLLRPIFEQEREIHKYASQQITRLCRPYAKHTVSIFWRLSMVKKSETLNVVVVAKSQTAVPAADLEQKISDFVNAKLGFAAKIEVVAQSDFQKSYFNSQAAQTRFENEYAKLKGASLAELVGDTKNGKKK